jgi:hypothetical protein
MHSHQHILGILHVRVSYMFNLSPNTVCVPTHPVISRPHALTDHRYNSLPFSIQNSNSYSFMSQTFMLQVSHMSNTSDAARRVSHNREASDVAATTTSSWILAATTSSRPSRLEF